MKTQSLLHPLQNVMVIEVFHRPYIRKEVRQEVESRAKKDSQGRFLDANTGKPIEGKYDLGHKYGNEFWREAQKAEKEGLTQKQFNEKMQNPDLYQIEEPHENRSHSHEMPDVAKAKTTQTQSNKGEETMGKTTDNEFLQRIKADKATIARCNEVSRNASKNANIQSGKKSGIDNGGMERADSGPLSHGRESGNKTGQATFHSSSGQCHSSSGQGKAGHSSGQGSGGHGNSGGHGSSGGHGNSGGHGGHGGGH